MLKSIFLIFLITLLTGCVSESQQRQNRQYAFDEFFRCGIHAPC